MTEIHGKGNKKVQFNRLDLSAVNNANVRGLSIVCESSDETDGSGRAQKLHE